MRVDKAVVLAGGKSSRMGQDKALLPFGGYSSLTQYQYEKLLKIFKEVYISSKTDKFSAKFPLIIDKSNISSPMVALKSIFEELNCNIFVIGVDMPLVSNQIVTTLIDEFENGSFEIVYASSSFGKEPLCGVYHKNVLHKIKELLKSDIHKLNTLLDSCSTKEIYFDTKEPFTNINYYKEYQRLLTLH